ncbi:hypothetical protein [Nitratireductor pacificus]|uniref:Spore coat protein U domain-containing protein n=1 Tax=Nitratireductor pacificus pht-3B TaxID=391937 RepID=K2N9Z6_9HYPH|nr:hypothetical protein [Nitratireductor pacificus]EKF20948.1 hypothetical protein NA2_01180 [Nitratireductor pacificus pht-3B]
MRRASFLSLILAAISTSAGAVDGSVIFNGTVLSTCLITIGTPGTLAANAGFTALSSDEAGGISGTATILTTGLGYNVSTAAPSAFTSAPAGGDDSVTFASSYSASGVTSLLDVVGTLTSPLGLGLTNLNVDLTATKSAGHFPAGVYSAVVTVTCE